MGTVGYMSPEQVQGEVVDHRSDIFSFGAILYEMLSGDKAFGRKTAAETMAAIMRDEPPKLSESGLNISPALDHIVRHCLEKNRDNRFQTAKDVAFNLSEQSSQPVASAGPAVRPTGKRRAVIAGAVIVVLAVGAGLLMRRLPRGAPEVRSVKRVAVLPFENLGSPEDDYFADGMADTVRGKLTTLPGVVVIARNSSTPYKKTTKTLKEVADELQVGYLLTATVRWQKGTAGASRVEVSPELVEIPASGTPISKWQQPFNAALTDVFQVQSDIATRVAQALGVALGAGEEKRLTENPTQNLAAYEAYLRGEESSNSLGILDANNLRRALALYEQAVALDPGFAQAWVQVARASALLYSWGVATPALAERSRFAAERAVALDPSHPEAYLALGDYQSIIIGDKKRAREHYVEGQRRAPANVDLLTAMAVTEQELGRWEEGILHLLQAENLDPRSAVTKWRLGFALLWLRRYPEAREAFERGLVHVPGNLVLITGKATSFIGQGDLPAARAALHAAPKEVETVALVAYVASPANLVWVLDDEQRQLLLRLPPSAFDEDKGHWAISLAQAYALEKDTAGMHRYAEEARGAFEDQVRMAPESVEAHACLGLALAYLGEKQRAVQEGLRGTSLLPLTKDAYSGPYYQHLLARIYVLVGKSEEALDQLELLLKIPFFVSRAWLKIDPNFDPLRKNPRFQKLVGATK